MLFRSQIVSQLVACVVALAWAGGLAYILFTLIGGRKNHSKMRVSEEVEKEGLDIHIHGTECYPAQGKAQSAAAAKEW